MPLLNGGATPSSCELQGPQSRASRTALSRSDPRRCKCRSPSQSLAPLLRFVKLVTETAYKTTDGDVETLRGHGWTDPQIAECVYITALFAFFNRVADAFGIEDPQYFNHPPVRGGEPADPPNPGTAT